MKIQATKKFSPSLLVSLLLVVQACRSVSATKQAGSPPVASPVEASPAATSGDSPLKLVQDEFRSTYEAARDRTVTMLSTLIVSRFSDLFLFRSGMPTLEGKGIPPKYLRLHRTAHVPFVVYLKVEPYFGQPLPDTCRTELDNYKVRLEAAVPDLVNYEFTDAEQGWQKEILRETCDYLTTILQVGAAHRQEFDEYERGVHGAVMELADSAGASQVEATHRLVTEWRKLLTDQEWQRLRVLVVGPRQPRHDNAATQYFAAVFPGVSNSLYPGESTRVFFLESLTINRKDKAFEEERGALAALLLDRKASTEFFNNPYRMSVDIVADGARDRIEELDLSVLR
ncbi:MAG: hypothetical protein ACKVXR_16820 [Planctomycetota bacterium]